MALLLKNRLTIFVNKIIVLETTLTDKSSFPSGCGTE